MIFDWSATAALAAVQNTQPEAPLTLNGEGLWVCLVSSGTCTASLDDIGSSPAGSALILPPQNAPAGHLVLSRSPLTLTPAGACHLLCLQLTGQAALQFLAGLPELPVVQYTDQDYAGSSAGLTTLLDSQPTALIACGEGVALPVFRSAGSGAGVSPASEAVVAAAVVDGVAAVTIN